MVMNDTAERIKNNLTLQNKSKVLRMIMKDDILSPKFWARKFEQPPFAAEQIVAVTGFSLQLMGSTPPNHPWFPPGYQGKLLQIGWYLVELKEVSKQYVLSITILCTDLRKMVGKRN